MVGWAGGRVVWEEGRGRREPKHGKATYPSCKGTEVYFFCFVLFWRYLYIYFLPPFSRAIPVPERELVDSREALAE